MILEVTPTTWTIDESKPSKMVFTVTNNCSSSRFTGIEHSEHFIYNLKVERVKTGITNTFIVEYLPNKKNSTSEMKLSFFSIDNRQDIHLQIEREGINAKCEANNLEKEENSDFLECKICNLKYDEDGRAPRMLTCGHTLCSECAESLWKDQNRQKISCPFDRTVTTLPNSQLGINNLAKNFLALELLEAEKEPKIVKYIDPIDNTNTTTEPSDTPCAENSHHEATVFCTTCEVDLCEKCFKITHGSKIFQSHKKVPFSEKPIQLPKCSIHSYNTAEFQCQEFSCSQPSKVFCHTCLLQQHKGHSYEHLMEAASKNQQELEDLVQKICAKMGELQRFVQLQERSRASYQPNSSLILERRNNIIEQFEEKKRAALLYFDSGVDRRMKKCQMMKQKLESQSRNVSEIKKEVEKILKSKVNLFRIDDVAKRVKEILGETTKHFVALDDWDSSLNEKMEMQWRWKEKPVYHKMNILFPI